MWVRTQDLAYESRTQVRDLTIPGDGSEAGWRTPVIAWSVLPLHDSTQHPSRPPRDEAARCGQVNSIRRSEVFVLNPGQCRVLDDLAGPMFKEPGQYRIVFYYQNIPDLKPGGAPFEPHDATALALMQKSTACLLRSNELTITVLEITPDFVNESKTRARLGEWVSYFALYHRTNQSPARSMLDVFKSAFPTWQPFELANVFIAFSSDEWRTKYSHSYEVIEGRATVVTVSSAGPDRMIGTVDDLSVSAEL